MKTSGQEMMRKGLPKDVRLLGFAFLLQFVTSLTAGLIQNRYLIFPHDPIKTLQALAEGENLFRMTVFLDGLTALGVVFLGAMLYRILKGWGRNVALTGFGFYVVEAVIHLVERVQTFALLEIGKTMIAAENPANILMLTKHTLLVKEMGGSMMMLAFCSGAILLYSLLVKSRLVPKALSVWGLTTVSLLGLWTILGIFGIQIPFVFYLPYVPFEFVIGVWLLTRPKDRSQN